MRCRVVAKLMPLFGIVQMRLRIATETHRIRADKKRYRDIRHVVQKCQVVRLRNEPIVKRETRRTRMTIPRNSCDWASKS